MKNLINFICLAFLATSCGRKPVKVPVVAQKPLPTQPSNDSPAATPAAEESQQTTTFLNLIGEIEDVATKLREQGVSLTLTDTEHKLSLPAKIEEYKPVNAKEQLGELEILEADLELYLQRLNELVQSEGLPADVKEQCNLHIAATTQTTERVKAYRALRELNEIEHQLSQAGFNIVFIPFAQLKKDESVTNGSVNQIEGKEYLHIEYNRDINEIGSVIELLESQVATSAALREMSSLFNEKVNITLNHNAEMAQAVLGSLRKLTDLQQATAALGTESLSQVEALAPETVELNAKVERSVRRAYNLNIPGQTAPGLPAVPSTQVPLPFN